MQFPAKTSPFWLTLLIASTQVFSSGLGKYMQPGTEATLESSTYPGEVMCGGNVGYDGVRGGFPPARE